MQEVDAAAAEISGRLGALAGAARAAQDEAGRLVAAIAAADRSAEKSRNQLAEIEAQIAAESGPRARRGRHRRAALDGADRLDRPDGRAGPAADPPAARR